MKTQYLKKKKLLYFLDKQKAQSPKQKRAKKTD